jgi:hypothetical protein
MISLEINCLHSCRSYRGSIVTFLTSSSLHPPFIVSPDGSFRHPLREKGGQWIQNGQLHPLFDLFPLPSFCWTIIIYVCSSLYRTLPCRCCTVLFLHGDFQPGLIQLRRDSIWSCFEHELIKRPPSISTVIRKHPGYANA